jgi:WD40 repeat protein
MSADQPAARPPQPRQVRTINADRQLTRVRFSPCGQFLVAAGYDAAVRRWAVADAGLTPLPSLAGHHGWVQAVAFHPDRRRLFTADSWGEIRVWTYAEREARASRVIASAHDGWIHDLAISHDGRLVATCGMDRVVRVWSADNGRKVHELTGHEADVLSVAFHPRNGSLVSGDLFGNVLQWDASTGRRTRRLDASALYKLSRLQDVGGVRCLAFDRAGATLACAGTRPSVGANVQGVPTTLLFDWTTGQLRHTLAVGSGGDGFVCDLAFHADGYVLAVTSGNPGTGRLLFHRPGEAEPFFNCTRMPNCHSLGVHPDGRRLVVAATNGGSNGNGRPLRNGEYAGNFSPLHLWELPAS